MIGGGVNMLNAQMYIKNITNEKIEKKTLSWKGEGGGCRLSTGGPTGESNLGGGV